MRSHISKVVWVDRLDTCMVRKYFVVVSYLEGFTVGQTIQQKNEIIFGHVTLTATTEEQNAVRCGR